jgi:hypothetical protein
LLHGYAVLNNRQEILLKQVKCRSRFGWLLAGSFFVAGTFTAVHSQQCRRVVMNGKVSASREWSRSFGQGWKFRVIPIKPGEKEYSGWDLVVDRDSGAGFPDALLLATPPYDSISQREIGTTFGLRAQDAIGWNPRNFRFLVNPADLRKAQKLYFTMRANQDESGKGKGQPSVTSGKAAEADTEVASRSMMEIVKRSAAGQFRILNAELTPGTANALPYAENWALQQRNTPHSITMTETPTPYGKLDSLEFEITLWLPASWKVPKGTASSSSSCP